MPTAGRHVVTESWVPFAKAGDVVLRYPTNRIELTGYHQSNHEGAQPLTDLPGVVRPVVMEGRDRLTSARTAADAVVDPGNTIRAPVTGVVKRAGTYTLYCKYSDDYVVIAPDSHPSWEVKILHIDHQVAHAGERVTAGVTMIAPRATKLPFESQTDEYSAKPPWPHVHIEVVNPAIRNVPNPGSGC